jgi:hypothetical protein
MSRCVFGFTTAVVGRDGAALKPDPMKNTKSFITYYELFIMEDGPGVVE